MTGIDNPRAIAFADIENDGDVDFAVRVKRSRNWLVRNDYSGDNNWIQVKLVSPAGQAGALGAKTRVYSAGTRADGSLLGFRESRSNWGYLGQDDPILHFGLRQHDTASIEVVFSYGPSVAISNVKANQIITITGPRSEP